MPMVFKSKKKPMPMSVSAMKKREAKEGPGMEKLESKAYQRKEEKYGIEKHKR